MGALAPVANHWLPQDDLLLKNAVEAGASLESLAKGAVQFSHRFTVQELQDRWHTLLYDPVVSYEASVRMIEFERSAPMAQSKLNKIDNSKGAKCISKKRKSESVRKCYYAMRKRICNEPFDSMDLIFLDKSGCGDAGNGNAPTSTGYLLRDQVSNYFGSQELNGGVTDDPLVELGLSGAASCGDGFSTVAFCTGLNEQDSFSPGQCIQPQNLCPPFDENLSLTRYHNSINECGPCQEMQACDLLKSVNGGVKSQNMFGLSVDKEGTTTLQSLGCSSLNPQMPVLSSIDSVSESTLADVCLGDNEPHGKRVGVHSKSELKDQMTSGSMSNFAPTAENHCSDQTTGGESKVLTPNAEEYFEQLSNSLLNFTPEDELLFMDADGKDIIDKSYIDNLSSLLLDFPDESDIPSLGLAEASFAPQECLSIPSGAQNGEEWLDIPSAAHNEEECLDFPTAADHEVSGDKELYHCDDLRQVWNIESQKLSSALTVNPIFPELRNGVICCTLNTEDIEIPNNDDVFLPIWMPSPSTSLMTNAKSDEAYYPVTSSVKAFSYSQKATDRVIMKGEQSNYVNLQDTPHVTESRLLSEMGPNHQLNDHGLRFELPCSDIPHVVHKKTDSSECAQGANVTHLSKKDIIHESLNKNLMKVEQADNLNQNHNSGDSDIHNAAVYKQEVDGISMQEVYGISIVQMNDDIHKELCSIVKTVPKQAVNCAVSNEEEFSCGSDDDMPYFSDVEAMILDMDLSLDDQDVCHNPRVLRYQHGDTRRTIIRLEQAADAYMQRSIAAQGALAVLYGRRSKHFIKKPEVLLGRGTEDMKVDIDLGREARANKISRRQATIKMEIDGSFLLKNHGKCPTFVNGKVVLPGHNVSLISGCLIEIFTRFSSLDFIAKTGYSKDLKYLFADISKNTRPSLSAAANTQLAEPSSLDESCHDRTLSESGCRQITFLFSLDEAALCNSCDHRVHHANKLASKHHRFSLLQPPPKQAPLCDICQERRAFLFCQQDRAILCRECDIPIHKANEHTQKHNRFLLTGVKLSAKSSLYSSSSPSECSDGVPTFNPHQDTVINKPVPTNPTNIEKGTDFNADQMMTDGGDNNNKSPNTSSIAEYLIEMLPGWHVEDFLDSSSSSPPFGFCKSTNCDDDLIPFWDENLQKNNLSSSFLPESTGLWVPQAAAPLPTQTQWVFSTSNMGSKEMISNIKSTSGKWNDDNSFAVPQISPPASSKRIKITTTTLW
ncbi:hypothetical protein ACH5RR_027439 [Cinchona calisaya]|uniref:FHA domain-containing protein n=1 Tax=Cinchona calisaya TaxID=153742 RepID=A0ABD2Z5G2_9GENT